MASTAGWPREVAQRIRKAIRDSGLAEQRIAELSDIPMTTFRRRVRGVNPWTLTEISAVAKVLNIDPRKLVQVDDDRSREAS
ncbi:helix-turn-helix domain-containing protein [Nocardia sp. NPDC004260]